MKQQLSDFRVNAFCAGVFGGNPSANHINDCKNGTLTPSCMTPSSSRSIDFGCQRQVAALCICTLTGPKVATAFCS